MGRGRRESKQHLVATVEHREPGASAASSHVLKHTVREALSSQFADEKLRFGWPADALITAEPLVARLGWNPGLPDSRDQNYK